MKILDSKFMKGFIKMADDGFQQGWHERNGGNLSYRLKAEEVEMIRPRLNAPGEWQPIGTEVPGLAGEFFLVTGSGKYFRNIAVDPEACLAIIELDDKGVNYRIRWGLVEGGRPTSELPTHLMNHEVKKKLTNGRHRVIYHAHTTNTIALTFVLPLDDKVFTRELWESATECPVVFPDGVGGGNQQFTAGNSTDDVGIDHDADRGNDLIGAGSTGQQAGIMQDIHAENRVHRDAVIGIHACRPPCGSAAAEIMETGSSCLLLTHVLSNSYSTIK